MAWINVTMAQLLQILLMQEDVLPIYLMIYQLHVLWETIALIQYTTALIARISFAQNQGLVLNMMRHVMEFAIVCIVRMNLLKVYVNILFLKLPPLNVLRQIDPVTSI